MKPLLSVVAILAAMTFSTAAGLLVQAESDVSPFAKSGDNRIVYVTKTGSKYHLAGCNSLSKSALPIKLGDARRDYRPCSVCNPPK